MSESALLPKFFPDPQAVGGPDRQRETHLMRQHTYLAAMMGVMHDHVGKHGGTAGPSRASPSISAQRKALSASALRA